LVAASGVAGYGNGESIHVHRSGDLYICGDEKTDAVPGVGLMAPRVGLVAQVQANLVMEILLGAEGRHAGASR
jgi:sulfur carrier protein ThiS adenylyltransferase